MTRYGYETFFQPSLIDRKKNLFSCITLRIFKTREKHFFHRFVGTRVCALREENLRVRSSFTKECFYKPLEVARCLSNGTMKNKYFAKSARLTWPDGQFLIESSNSLFVLKLLAQSQYFKDVGCFVYSGQKKTNYSKHSPNKEKSWKLNSFSNWIRLKSHQFLMK